jgi:hypothetical protein
MNQLKNIALLSVPVLCCVLPAMSQQQPIPNQTGFDTYEVPALSSIPRLPDRLPKDGKLSKQLRVVAAQGEFEPASFVIAPRTNVAKLEFKTNSLSGPAGSIPASAIDIKIVKTWYQGGTAWYSYFADNNRRELTPELLLNDETLVRVDHKTKDNYLRIGNEYKSISYPMEKAEKSFNYLTEPVADAKSLQPIQLVSGEIKQIWVTVKVPEGTASGTYRGPIEMIADGRPAGSMELVVRVLPFSLPAPKTYYDIDKDYLVTIYSTNILDLANRSNIPEEVANIQQKAIYKNLLEHNVYNVRSSMMIGNNKDREQAIRQMRRELRLMKEAGIPMKPLLSNGWVFYSTGEDKDINLFKNRIDDLARVLKEETGHNDIYVTSWDEAGVDRIKIYRELAEYSASKGLKLWVTTARGKHFDLAGHVIDFANHGGWPNREDAAIWHSIGSKVASYAGPHTGPESPTTFRLWEGLARYKANYDGSFNYKYFSQLHTTLHEKLKQNVWNDFVGGAFRSFNMVHPTSDGVIDTIAWEGFREGIDDVRYATLLKSEAKKAVASGKVGAMTSARKALMWLELLDEKSADLNTTRMEMIEHILKIQEELAK